MFGFNIGDMLSIAAEVGRQKRALKERELRLREEELRADKELKEKGLQIEKEKSDRLLDWQMGDLDIRRAKTMSEIEDAKITAGRLNDLLKAILGVSLDTDRQAISTGSATNPMKNPTTNLNSNQYSWENNQLKFSPNILSPLFGWGMGKSK